MSWNPTTEENIWDLINCSYERMQPEQRRLWEMIKVIPAKWQQTPWGDRGGGFWVVAVVGSSVVWYNDIEHGFNCSSYSTLGKIEDYLCNQDHLEEVVQYISDAIKSGIAPYRGFGPPQTDT